MQDLLSTLGLPEWPASEVLLTLLGMLLVSCWSPQLGCVAMSVCVVQVGAFSNRSNEHQLRVTALEHLGVIAARLRRDAVSSTQEDHHQLIDILAEVSVCLFVCLCVQLLLILCLYILGITEKTRQQISSPFTYGH